MVRLFLLLLLTNSLLRVVGQTDHGVPRHFAAIRGRRSLRPRHLEQESWTEAGAEVLSSPRLPMSGLGLLAVAGIVMYEELVLLQVQYCSSPS